MVEINGGPTGREWGALTTEVKKMSHEIRNVKQSLTLLAEEIDSLETSLTSLQTKIYTTMAVCAAVASIVAFIVQNIK